MTTLEEQARRYAADVLRTIRQMELVPQPNRSVALDTFQRARSIAADSAAASVLAGNDVRARIAAQAWYLLGRAENRQVTRVIRGWRAEMRRADVAVARPILVAAP